MRNTIFFLLLFLIFSTKVFSQNTFNFGLGADFGLPVSGKYSESRDVLRSKSGHFVNVSLYFNTILSERIGFEIGAGQNNQVIKFSDERFKEHHDDKYDVKTTQKNFFPNLESSVFYIQPILDNTSLYFKAGYRWNFPGNKSKSQSSYFNQDGSVIEARSTFSRKTEGIFGEIGIRGRNNSPFYCGIKYYYGKSPNVTTDYTVTQKYQSYSDQVVSNGSFIGFSCGFNIQGFEWDYPNINFRRKKKKKTTKVVSPPVPVIAPDQRKEQIIRRMTLTNPVITIKVYDPNKIDNDIVSIKLNNQYVASDLVVVKEPWVKELTLRKGENRLTFQAMNLGKYSPNTAEMIVQSGTQIYKLQFNTTLELNQVLIITIP